MEDPFKVGLKAFFGVATGFGILVLTFNVIQSINYSINNFIEKQKREKLRIQREERREEKKNRKRETYKICRESYKKRRLEASLDARKNFKECLNYRTKKEIYFCVNVYSPFKK